MSESAATILAALIGFLGGLIVAALTFRQKADELFLAGLGYLKGGSQERNLGIAALELSWVSRRHRKAVAPLLVGTAIYLLLESGQKNAAHEVENLRRVMQLLRRPSTRKYIDQDTRNALVNSLTRKSSFHDTSPGLWLSTDQLSDWQRDWK